MNEQSYELSPVLVWFRQDLRVDDNPALLEALRTGRGVIPIYIWSPEDEGAWAPGAASRWWLHHSLRQLQADLEHIGLPLVLRSGPAQSELQKLIRQSGAAALYWNRRYEPAVIRRDTQLKATLREQGLDAKSFNGSLLFPPELIKTGQGKPYQVFTPYWKNCRLQAAAPARPEYWGSNAPQPAPHLDSDQLETWKLTPSIGWDAEFPRHWQPGTDGARVKLKRFLEAAVTGYQEQRNIPSEEGTSSLSPHLHFGEISVREVWWSVLDAFGETDVNRLPGGAATFLSEIGWREFAYHVLYHFPHTTDSPLRETFQQFPWENNPAQRKAWQMGLTGYPIVDAGMRQLWSTGWMHNRVRMIVGSFLCKDLMQSWLEGARWFWDTLVDADLAANTLGWQWISGCGADAAPYFRIFNPITQGKKFDPAGSYVRRWVPELAALPDRYLHEPWIASPTVLRSAGIKLGETYPHPIVDHADARQEALDRLSTITRK